MPKKTNRSQRTRRRQFAHRNPVDQGSYEEIWFDKRGNPVVAGAYEEVWSDKLGTKPKKGRRRPTKPTAIVQPIGGGASLSLEPLESLSDAELKAKYKSEFPGRGRCPAPSTMIKKLKDKGETGAVVVEPPKTKRRAKKPKTVKAGNVAPDAPSAPKREYAKIGRVTDIDGLQGPFTIDADAGEKGSKKIYFFDAAGKGYVYSPRGPKARPSALRRLAVAETSGDTPTSKDNAAIGALDKAIDKEVVPEGDLVVMQPEKKTPKRRTRKKPAPAKRTPPKRRAPKKALSLEDSFAAEIAKGVPAPVSALSLDDSFAAEIAKGVKKNRRNTRRRRNTQILSAKNKQQIAVLIRQRSDASEEEVKLVVKQLAKNINKPEYEGKTQEIVQYVVANIPKFVSIVRNYLATQGPAESLAPTAEDIVALIQNVAVSGAHEEATRAIANADKPTITKAWRLLTGKTTGRALSEANMRKAVLAFMDTKDKDPGVMTETGEPTEAGAVDMPSDAEARREIEGRIKAKVSEMMGAPAPRKPGRRTGGKKTPPKKRTPAGKKAPKVSAADIVAGVELDDILGNPRRRRPRKRKTTRRNRF